MAYSILISGIAEDSLVGLPPMGLSVPAPKSLAVGLIATPAPLTSSAPLTTLIPLGAPGLVLRLEESTDASGLSYAEMRLTEGDEILAFGSGSNRHQALLDLLISLSMAEARLIEEARETLEALAHNAVECILRGCAGESSIASSGETAGDIDDATLEMMEHLSGKSGKYLPNPFAEEVKP